MRRPDWTPAVLVTATVSVTVVLVVLVTSPWIGLTFRTEPGPGQARRRLASKVDVWVGDLAPGVVGVLSPVWGEPEPDREHDARLNEELALMAPRKLAWFHLLVFNTSGEEQTIALGEGALVIRPPDGGAAGTLQSVAALVECGEARLTPALRLVLEARGALRDSVTVPAGWMADLLVAFDRRVELDQAVEVACAGGETFRRRPMSRRDLEGLVESPDASVLDDL